MLRGFFLMICLISCERLTYTTAFTVLIIHLPVYISLSFYNYSMRFFTYVHGHASKIKKKCSQFLNKTKKERGIQYAVVGPYVISINERSERDHCSLSLWFKLSQFRSVMSLRHVAVMKVWQSFTGSSSLLFFFSVFSVFYTFLFLSLSSSATQQYIVIGEAPLLLLFGSLLSSCYT